MAKRTVAMHKSMNTSFDKILTEFSHIIFKFNHQDNQKSSFLQQLELAAAASGAGDANSPPSASSPGGGSSCGGVMGVTSLLSSPPDIINNSSVGTAGNAAQQNKKTSSRRNAWGNLSYADLITQAIKNSPDQRLTLSQVYEWMVANIPYFKDKGDSNSSAGWKVSVKRILNIHAPC